MSTVIDEQRMIEENVFAYEERAKSSLMRYVEGGFTPTTYFHIKNTETTNDGGFLDVAEILGKDSPIKYQRIDNFPIVGLGEMLIQLQDSDWGLDGAYEGEGTTLPSTIRPLQNDCFMITYLRNGFIFRITSVEYDSIMPSGCYKINFILEYIDNEKETCLQDQTVDTFTCIWENIGTKDKCIIQSASKEKIDKIDAMYDDMANTYLTFFYVERYNSLLGNMDSGHRLFDPLQVQFVNKHNLFNKKNSLNTILLTDQFKDNMRKIKYEKSIYRFFERRDLNLISNFPYFTFRGISNVETSFYRWRDENVLILDNHPKMMDPNNPEHVLFTEGFKELLRLNGPTDSKYVRLMQRFLRREELTLSDIDLSLNEELLYLEDANLEVFFFTPIIMYIIKTIMNDCLNKKEEEGVIIDE